MHAIFLIQADACHTDPRVVTAIVWQECGPQAGYMRTSREIMLQKQKKIKFNKTWLNIYKKNVF